MSNSFWRHGLQPTRFLSPWGFSRQDNWSGLPCSPPGDLPRIKPRSSTLQADSLPSKPPGKWGEINYKQEWCGFFFNSICHNMYFSGLSTCLFLAPQPLGEWKLHESRTFSLLFTEFQHLQGCMTQRKVSVKLCMGSSLSFDLMTQNASSINLPKIILPFCENHRTLGALEIPNLHPVNALGPGRLISFQMAHS